MKTHFLLLILTLATLVGLGCSRQAKESVDLSGTAARAGVAWGPATQGVQCRIRPIKRLWRANETPLFTVDFRNRGKRVFAMPDDGSLHAQGIVLDGRWYSRPNRSVTEGKLRRLGPEDQLADFSLSLSRDLEIPLDPGSHTIKAVFSLEGLEIVSNPVRIEISSQ
jgi:hypothetical protein